MSLRFPSSQTLDNIAYFPHVVLELVPHQKRFHTLHSRCLLFPLNPSPQTSPHNFGTCKFYLTFSLVSSIKVSSFGTCCVQFGYFWFVHYLASSHPRRVLQSALRGWKFLIGAIWFPFVVVRATLAFLTSLLYHVSAGGTSDHNPLPILHVGPTGRAKTRGQFPV